MINKVESNICHAPLSGETSEIDEQGKYEKELSVASSLSKQVNFYF